MEQGKHTYKILQEIPRQIAEDNGIEFATSECRCNDDATAISLDFIGDSIIARWDIDEYFPTWQVYNYGVSGAGIDYIEGNAGRFAGKQVVVTIGTNNINDMVPERIEKYTERYMSAIEGLGASRVYLYSLHPRNFSSDRSDVNTEVADFNDRIRTRVSEVPSIVYLDIYSDFIYKGEPNPQLYYDRLHLSPYGYEILVSALKKALGM